MASPRFDLLAAVRASTVDYELNASAVSAVAAFLSASLAVPYRIGVNVVFREFARCVAPLSPFVHRIETRATVGAAVFATFLLKLADERMRFRSRAVVSGNTAGIGLRWCRIADDDAAAFVLFRFSRWRFLLLLFWLFGLCFRRLLGFGDDRLGFGGFRLAFLCDHHKRLCLRFFRFG